ncbi:MAG: hypothetical protein A2381_03765 [Bdellovibrionales bacterium RIFOXYB1_FULL_37_110]|nr:MAG: hypothetical protein A2417_16360 [Bdellovibrionales bacterium RIFOXYC1_FULL_37_79]OFZ59153.1 MAG: hypothetical protein A2381_03765 [Bdellovibrionales bacterium RIFOXYB1_FULL_37_110]OFZ64158.1 MAG: hypothetical protein A2577_14795 [Bdellovibrionales bacterium RIFOXYD1_FULL_36_51]
MNLFKIVIPFFIFSTTYAQLPDFCQTEYIKSVKSQVDISSSQEFNYFYQKITKNESGPTFIIIPGGPGGTSISSYTPNPWFDLHEIQFGLPQKSNIILTDPRGNGCNRENNLNMKTYTTTNVANDILNIIKQEKLTDYILVGHSYGTMVATILDQLINKSLLSKPFALVLSGTLGIYFEQGNRFYGYEQSWNTFLHKLPKELQKILPPTLIGDNENFPFPFGIQSDKWLSFLADGLQEGESYINGEVFSPLKDKLFKLISNDETQLEDLKNEILLVPIEKEMSDFFYEIYCNEIEEESEDCLSHGYSVFSRPFDSSNYQIKTKIIYFQGGLDPATPPDKAKYHFENQKSSEKILITLPVGGHTTGIIINDCKEWFWTTLFSENFASLGGVVDKCPGNLIVEI